MKEIGRVPVVFLHCGRQNYLKTAIYVAQKNNDILLIGDNSNRDYCANWFCIDDYQNIKFENFKNNYKHMSSNSESFELMCFQRYFYLYEFMKKERLQTAIMVDSDVLVYGNLHQYFKQYNCGCAFSIPYKQEPYIWVAGPQCCYWTLNSLHSFIEYLGSFYDTYIDMLEEKYKYGKSKNKKGGICDMTALYLWGKERKDVLNLAIIKNNIVFDCSLQSSANYFPNEFCFDKILRIKKLYYVNDRLYFKTVRGELVEAVIVHCQGSSKAIMSMIYKKSNRIFLIVIRYLEFAKRIIKRVHKKLCLEEKNIICQ
ncbi:MAG: hypothetical protein NC313_07340 [Butyrivibrio sp.]|nr:hypothetical protein [Butyrivibrio sp.]